jgi:hypothetical protein
MTPDGIARPPAKVRETARRERNIAWQQGGHAFMELQAAGHVMSLQELSERVRSWREQRESGRSRIPEELLDAAARVARVYGVSATCKATGFCSYALHLGMNQAESGADQNNKTHEPATFVQVELSPVEPSACRGRVKIGSFVTNHRCDQNLAV